MSVEVEYDDIMAGLRILSESSDDLVMDAMDDIAGDIQADARSRHRYNSRTGNLERSIQKYRGDDYVEVYINTSIAPYGKYVHGGQRGWSPDEFMNEAYDRNQRKLDIAVDRALNNALSKSKL